MASNTQIIRDFVAAWSNLDPAELTGYFTEDGCYHNMPIEPVKGREAVQQFIANFAGGWAETQWDILNIVEEGDVVFCERLDRTKSAAGNVDLPCVGVFEMRDGKIQVWRDYFDLGTYLRAVG